MKRSLLAATVASLTAVAVIALPAAPASARPAPKPGSTCAVSGTVRYSQGSVYVCTSATEGATPRWGKGARVSASPLTIADGWAKAADTGMSAAFGMVTNPSGKTVRVIGASSPYAKVVQLHEVVQKDGAMVMQQKPGGFVIPAGSTLELKPGGNHMMFVGITKPITPGAMVPVTLITADGGQLRTTVMAKVFSGANETYDAGMSGMSGM